MLRRSFLVSGVVAAANLAGAQGAPRVRLGVDLFSIRSQAARVGIEVEIGMLSICPTSKTFDASKGTAEEQLSRMIQSARMAGSPIVRAVKSRAVDSGIKIAIENHAGDMQAPELSPAPGSRPMAGGRLWSDAASPRQATIQAAVDEAVGNAPGARSGALELLDQSNLSLRELSISLRDVGRLNRWFGGARAVVAEVGRVCRERGLAGRVSVLDIGTGGADIPRALVGWGKRHGIAFEIVACDRHAQVVSLAAAFSSSHESIAVLRTDALALPFLPRSFDFVTCSLLIHHLAEDEVIALLEKLRQLPRHALIACDLERSGRGRAGAWLATRVACCGRMTRHDGPLSVLRSYTLEELCARSRRAGCGEMRWSRRPFCRVVGVLEK